jgi:hypothetical protein
VKSVLSASDHAATVHIGMFLVGAYRESSAICTTCSATRMRSTSRWTSNGYRIERVIEGDSVTEV